MSLWLILLLVWLAPALIVGFLLWWNAKHQESAAPTESDAPPAE